MHFASIASNGPERLTLNVTKSIPGSALNLVNFSQLHAGDSKDV